MEVSEFKDIIWDYTRKIAETMNCAFSPIIEKYGLTMLQARILMELYHYEPHTIGSLADRICMAGTNISSMCKKLESQGFLERVRSQEDERVVLVALTKLGKETVLEIDRLCNERISKHLMNETEKTFEDIITGLRELEGLLQRISCIEED